MIYLFTGTDTEKARAKAFEWVAKARTKEPNLAYARLAREELTDAALTDAAGSGGLFARRLLVLLDDPYQAAKDEDGKEGETEDGNVKHSQNILDGYLEVLAASENAILILAPKLAAAKRKKIEELAKMTYAYDTAARSEAARGFNSALVNALASRKHDALWLEVTRALRAGDAPEMLHGLLHWKARDLMEKGSRAWSPTEARQLSLDLISLLQSSRRSGLPLPLALEKWALTI